MIVATAFICILVYGTYVFFLSRAKSRRDVFKLIPAFVVFTLLLFLTAMFSFSEQLAIRRTLALLPVESLAAYQNYEEDEKIVLIGQAVDELAAAIALPDGDLALINDEAFMVLRDEREFLMIGEPIVVYGEVIESHVIIDMLYAGTYSSYRKFLWISLIIPTVTMLLSLVIGLGVFILPFVYLRYFLKGTLDE